MRIIKAFGAVLLLASMGFAAGPVISAIAVSPVTPTTMTITWTTGVAASGQVFYGIGNTNMSSAFNGALTTSHSFTIQGLAQQTVYTYLVQSVDSGGSTTSPTNTVALCNPGSQAAGRTTVTAMVNAGYATGTLTAVWENDSGVSTSTPTVCGATFPTTQTTTVGLPGNINMVLPDNNYVVPSPGHWNFTLSNASGLNANQIISGQSLDLTTVFGLQAAPSSSPGSVAWGSITGTLSSQTDLETALNLKAPLASPALTGIPTVPTATPLTDNNQAASTAYVDTAVGVGGGSWTGVTAGSNPNVLTEAPGGSLSSTKTGQIAGTQVWLAPGVNGGSAASIIGPVVTVNPTGGSYNAANLFIVAWFNTTLGSTLPTPQAHPSLAACSTTCSVTVNEPTAILPGYTTWSVGSGQNSGTWDTNAECLNVPIATTSCTIVANATGALAPLVNSAWVQPPTMETNFCPPGVLPSLFQFDSGLESWPLGGTDFSSNNGRQIPTLDLCTPIQITDQGVEPVYGNNALLVVDHEQGQNTAVSTNQDRALWVGWSNSKTPSYAGAMYGAEAIQSELDFYCDGCTFSGEPDSEVAVASFQLNNEATSYGSSSETGTNTVRADWIRTGGGQDDENSTFLGVMDNGSATNAGGAQFSVFRADFASGGMGCAGCIATAFEFYPDSVRWQNGNIGFDAHSQSGFTPTFGLDWFARNEIHNYATMLNGTSYQNGLSGSDNAALAVQASLDVSGALTTTQISTGWNSNGAASPTCSGGSSVYTYIIVAVDSNGGTSQSASESTGASCTNPLTSGNPVTINFGGQTAFNVAMQSVTLDVYRTGGPMGDGLIGTITCGAPVQLNGCSSFSDTGIVATGTLPTGNTTGGMFAGGDIGFNVSAGQHFDTFSANNDHSGVLTCSGSSATKTFSRAYASTPVIVTSDETTALGVIIASKSASAFTITCPGASDVVDYIVNGNPN